MTMTHEQITRAAWLAEKYALTADEAAEVAQLPDTGVEVERQLEAWRATVGYPAMTSPLTRGKLLDLARGRS